MKLWDFAVAIHGEPGVDAGLLDLQDNHGQCVSYLLWAVWAARHGRAVDEAELALFPVSIVHRAGLGPKKLRPGHLR